MDAQLLETLNQFGALGLASGFIGWLYVRSQKRLDEVIAGFSDQLRELNERCDKKEAELRAACDERVARFDLVVERYNAERDTLHQGIIAQMKETATILKELNDNTEAMGSQVTTGLSEMRQHYAVLDARKGGK